MNRLNARFDALKEKNEAALICYLMAGDPSADKTLEIVRALDDAGVDAIELGVPFSDPMADGPSIQASAHRAIANGMNVPGVFETVRKIRTFSQIPIILMTYYNPTMHYGVERFAREAAEAGVDATIQTDLTPEEAKEWLEESNKNGLGSVFLVAPTSTEDRITTATNISTGFVYCVSRTGVTGAQSEVPAQLPAMVARVKAQTKVAVCVGFGISTPTHVSEIGAYADGVVVGSALINLIARECDNAAMPELVKIWAQSMKAECVR